MRIILRYGRHGLPVDIPDSAKVTVIRKPPMPTIDDSAAAVDRAIHRPVAAPALPELARGARSACIAICDVTRPVPNQLFLRPIMECLLAAGLDRGQITILVATGLHRPNEGDELQQLVGDPWVFQHAQVVNHFARNKEQHVLLGRTAARNTVVRLDRRFVQADLRIVTGLVEPHFMAGYSGGRKVIAPGLADVETITTFHNAAFMADPATANCNLEGNPLHEEQLEIVRMLGDVFALNTVIDEDRRLSFVNFGEVVASHAEAVDFVRPYCEISVPRRFATVVTCGAGYPLDNTYYQTVKGMVGAVDILAPGGDLIIAAACAEGLGSEEFIDAQRRLVANGPQQFLESILSKPHAEIDEWQTQMQLKPMALGRIFLYAPALSPHELRWTGVTAVDSLSATVQESLNRSPDRAVAVIPEGPYVVPFVNYATTCRRN